MRTPVVEYKSCLMNGAKPGGRHNTVPCKLNNAKTNKTPWTIDELFKFRVNEFKPTKILEYNLLDKLIRKV